MRPAASYQECIDMNTRDTNKQTITKFLKRVPIFRNFSEKNLDKIVDEFRITTVKKGDDIVFQADEGTDFFLILKGKVRVSLLGPDGNEFILTEFKEGDFFGEISLIDGKARSANVVAEDDTALSSLSRDIFVSTMKQNPAIAFDLLLALVERLRKANDMIETLAFLDVHERLIKFIVNDAESNGEKGDDGIYRVKKRTHNELASNIGSSREAVSKAMKVLLLKQTIKEVEGYYCIGREALKEVNSFL